MKSTSDLQNLYITLKSVLETWAPFWRHSVLDHWDEVRGAIPEDWLTWARGSSSADWFHLSRQPSETHAPASLRNFISLCRQFEESLTPRDGTSSIHTHWTTGLTPKKKHEIECLLHLLGDHAPGTLIDIGGGAGYLARQFARVLGCQVHSIDRDVTLQHKGAEICKTQKWSTPCEGKIRFHACDFPHDLPEVISRAFGHAGTLSIGLHTCGPLAWRHLELAAEGKGQTLNLGCCYELLNLSTDVNRSEFCRLHPIEYCDESLHLMTRGGHHVQFSDFEFQQRVLTFRYSLEEVLRVLGQEDRSRDVGTAPLALYRGDWVSYVSNRLEKLGIHNGSLSHRELAQIFEASGPRVLEQRFAALLRNCLARPLEISLLLDRVFWLEEQTGRTVTPIRVFDPSISPRNIGIWMKGG